MQLNRGVEVLKKSVWVTSALIISYWLNFVQFSVEPTKVVYTAWQLLQDAYCNLDDSRTSQYTFPTLKKKIDREDKWGQRADQSHRIPPYQLIPPPYEINVPIHIQTCHTYHNPIFSWRSRWKRFFPIQSHQGCLERRERQPGGIQQEKLDVMIRRCDTSYNHIYVMLCYVMADTMEMFS